MATRDPRTKITTGKVLFSYAHVFKPQAIEDGSDEKYSISCLISKKDKDTLKKFKEAYRIATENAIREKYAGKMPKKWKDPLRDGDEEEKGEEYEGHYFFTASSLTKPKILDRNFNEIIDPEDFYSGCYGRAMVNLYAFDVAGNKGIAVGLEALMKLSDGEPLGGGVTLESVKAAFQDDFEDEEYDDLD